MIVRVLAALVLALSCAACADQPPPVPPIPPTTVTAAPTVIPDPTVAPTTTTPVPVPTSTTTAPPVSTDPAAPPADACVAPAGQTKLIDQDPSDSQKPWKRPPGEKVVFYYPVKGFTAEWRGYVEYAARAWNVSPCVDLRVVDTCPAGSNCIKITIGDGGGDDGNFNDKLSGKFTVGGNIEVLSTLKNTSAKVTPPLPPGGERLNVMVHEIGHSIGLAHRKGLIDPNTGRHLLMNEDTFDDVMNPDAIDLQNLAYSYTVLQK